MKKLPLQKIFLAIVLILITAAAMVSVQSALAYKLSVPFPGQPSDINGPSQYIKTIYNFGLGFAALLGVLMIVIGGIRYTISEAVPSKEDAKEQITSAIWGLILLLTAVLILKTINPQIPELKEPEVTKLPPASAASATAGTNVLCNTDSQCNEPDGALSDTCNPPMPLESTSPHVVYECRACNCVPAPEGSIYARPLPDPGSIPVGDITTNACNTPDACIPGSVTGNAQAVFVCSDKCRLILQPLGYAEPFLCDNAAKKQCSPGQHKVVLTPNSRFHVRDIFDCSNNCVWHISKD